VCAQGSVSTTIIDRAILILSERFSHLKVTFGCSHSETLTVLRELVLIYWKQKTKESHVTIARMLLETTIEIISKEKHSRTLYEAAKAIGGIYLKCGLVEEGRKLLREIHNQIVSKSYASTRGFKIDQSIGKGSYVFLVTFEEVIHGSTTISYSKTRTNLLTETILYESYHRCLKSGKDIEVIISTCARLYVFLKSSHRKEQMDLVRDEAYKHFTKKWGNTILKTRTEITFIFFISLLQELGAETRHTHIGTAACISANKEVRELLNNGQVKEAYEVALCAFQFIEHQRAYHSRLNVGYGFKLSAYMALRSLPKPVEKIDPELRTKMLSLSRQIINEVLKACRESEIDFVRLKLGELNDLVGLLGEQGNYADLETLLNELWSSREVHKNWSQSIIISLGQRLVQARFLGSSRKSAISLCQTIVYNLRRVWGSLDPKTLEMSELLSQAYTAAGHYREAMRVHEDVLRLVVEGDDGDDRTLDTMTPERARKHLFMLKQSYLRLGGWDKHEHVYKELVNQLLAMPVYRNSEVFKGVHGVEKWSLKEKVEGKGEFERPIEWGFVESESLDEKGDVLVGESIGVSKNRPSGFKRVTSNWGLNGVYQHLIGNHVEHELAA
jgi:hypothetical protein